MVTAESDYFAPEDFRPLRRVEFDQLIELGVFEEEEERVELLEGLLVRINAPGPEHSSAVDKLAELLFSALVGHARIRVQNPFAASDISQPQPDLMVAPLADYRRSHPAEAHLVIEVSDTSLRKDRGRKLRIYAQQGVPEYWIVDVNAQRIEVYREPSGSAFEYSKTFGAGETIALLRYPDVLVPVDDVFAP